MTYFSSGSVLTSKRNRVKQSCGMRAAVSILSSSKLVLMNCLSGTVEILEQLRIVKNCDISKPALAERKTEVWKVCDPTCCHFLLVFNWQNVLKILTSVARLLVIWHWFSLRPCGGQWAVGRAKSNHVGTEKGKLGCLYLSGNVEPHYTSQNNFHRVRVVQSDWCVMTHPATCLSITSILWDGFLHSHVPQRLKSPHEYGS